ncbi:MAG: hypothetical protein ACUVQ9_07285 [Thermodesulfobacteriota bacterium]
MINNKKMILTRIFINFWKPLSSYPRQKTHLILAGINQKLFLTQWGEPELKISLDRLKGFYSSQHISLMTEVGPDDTHTVWVYERMDRIFFFKKGNLMSHFKWSEFKKRLKRSLIEEDQKPNHHFRPSFAQTFTLVA